MTGFEELTAAYERMSKECSFKILGIFMYEDDDGNETYDLDFEFFGVGAKMYFVYEFILQGDPCADDIFFGGDPKAHFSIYCYRIITDFIETMQKYRADQKLMMEFIADYLALSD